MTSSEILLIVPKQPFLRMHSKSVAEMAANAIKCSTVEVQYDKSTSLRTTAVRYLGHR